VDDTVAGFLRAAEVDGAVGRTVQLGTGSDISIGDLAKLAIDVLESPAEVVSREERMRPANSEVERLVSDPTLANQLLDWRPEVSLEEGLLQTSTWLRDRLEGYRVEEYVV
jgi:dTDP-glucose 4,6-dehydratase